MAQINLYYRTQLESKVSLLPEQIDADIDTHLLNNLKAKIEGKTNDHGIVLKIVRLIDYGYGIIEKINFMTTTVYEVKYECFICSPTKNLEIICILQSIIKGYLIAKNGPVIIAVESNNFDTQKFKMENGELLYKDGTKIKKGDYLKVSIINIKNNLGERKITTVCKLLNKASDEEIRLFENDQRLIADENDDIDEKEFI